MSITATIKWYDAKKGYGFATPETGGEDIFVHSTNIAKTPEGKRPYIDEGDIIYYELGEHNGRPTAVSVTLPVDRPDRKPPRRRGRDAKKSADADAEAEDQAGVEKATAELKGEGKPDGTKREGGGGGGRDGKTHRRSNNRPRRNDKGLGGSEAKPGSGSTGRGDKKADAKQAARESAGEA
jgi:CspA family cold shock protein